MHPQKYELFLKQRNKWGKIKEKYSEKPQNP